MASERTYEAGQTVLQYGYYGMINATLPTSLTKTAIKFFSFLHDACDPVSACANSEA